MQGARWASILPYNVKPVWTLRVYGPGKERTVRQLLGLRGGGQDLAGWTHIGFIMNSWFKDFLIIYTCMSEILQK